MEDEARHGPLSSGEKREYGTLGGGPSPLIQEAQDEGGSYRGDRDGEGSYGDVSVTVESDAEDALWDDGGAPSGNQIGGFMGVFVPCNLAIFGAIVFERMGWVVGQAGLGLSIVLLLLGYSVVTLTTMSMSAIATNGVMKGGGAYFMISRSLGPSFGGSIGIMFYFANICGAATQMLGFIEALGFPPIGDTLPESYLWNLLYGAVTLFVLLLICLVGANAFAKTAIMIWVVMWISLVAAGGSMLLAPAEYHGEEQFTGLSWPTLQGNFGPGFSDEPDLPSKATFMSVFGVFFPTCTGIMAGANMSGDLANPSKSIPVGTFGALAVTFAFYVGQLVLMASTVTREGLQENYMIMQSVVFWWPFVAAGIFACSLSSALNNLIGSSRILQAIARDRIVPGLWFFQKGSGSGDEPRRAVVLSYLLIQGCLLVGAMNVMATITTMFFLISYGTVNLAVFVQKWTASPQFRPTFKYFNMWLSLLGAVLCIATMFMVAPIAAAIAICAMLFLFIAVFMRSVETDWGDVGQAVLFHHVRKYLLQLDARKEHVKYWKPSILLLVSDANKSVTLMDFVNNLKKGGLFIIGNVIEGEFQEQVETLRKTQRGWLDFIAGTGLKAFASVVVAPSIRTGIDMLLSASGLGALQPNTVIFGMHKSAVHRKLYSDYDLSVSGAISVKMLEASLDHFGPSRMEHSGDDITVEEYMEMIHDTLAAGKHVLIARGFARLDKDMVVAFRGSRILHHRTRLTIDMWPIAYDTGGAYEFSTQLLLLLGYVLKQTSIWNVYAKLRVKTIVSRNDRVGREYERLERRLQQSRITSRIEVHTIADGPSKLYREVVRSGELREDASNFRELDLDTRMRLLNEIIMSQSSETCVCFITMPAPNRDVPPRTFVDGLYALTHNLPPCMLVHGAYPVIRHEL